MTLKILKFVLLWLRTEALGFPALGEPGQVWHRGWLWAFDWNLLMSSSLWV